MKKVYIVHRARGDLSSLRRTTASMTSPTLEQVHEPDVSPKSPKEVEAWNS